VQDAGQVIALEGAHDHVNVVGHDTPSDQIISLAIEVL
jgi:hypothetical protein